MNRLPPPAGRNATPVPNPSVVIVSRYSGPTRTTLTPTVAPREWSRRPRRVTTSPSPASIRTAGPEVAVTAAWTPGAVTTRTGRLTVNGPYPPELRATTSPPV